MKQFNGNLIFAPHPDDEILCCSSRLQDSSVVVVSNGDLGTGGLRDTMDEHQYVKARELESFTACLKYWIWGIHFMHFSERDIDKSNTDLVNSIINQIIRDKPKNIYITDIQDEQQVHKTLGRIVNDIVWEMNQNIPDKKTRIRLWTYTHGILNRDCQEVPLNDQQWNKKFEQIKSFKTQEHWLIQHVLGHTNAYQTERFYVK